ncbi:MAG: zinc-binding dehydrogenase [Actinobacteria bacterium]|nr:zinc-binding dehydrogenase [Actinomycetota bacterium]
MKAVKIMGRNRIEIIEKPKPVAHDDIVVIKVTASGICGSEIHRLLKSEIPIEVTPGHEVAGIVAEVDKAREFKIGDRVIVDCHITCGNCNYCKSGDLIFCDKLVCVGFDIDGGDAEYLAIPESSLRHLPDDISDNAGVLIVDTLGTPYHAVKKAGIIQGENAGIFGVGPIGQLAALISKSYGAAVTTIDVNNTRLQKSLSFGADYTVNPYEIDLCKKINEITNNIGFDRIIECAGENASINSALDTLKCRGKMVMLGVSAETVEINPWKQIIHKEVNITGSDNFNNNEFPELIEFVRKNPVVSDVITHKFYIDDAQKAFDTVRNGEGLKVIILP